MKCLRIRHKRNVKSRCWTKPGPEKLELPGRRGRGWHIPAVIARPFSLTDPSGQVLEVSSRKNRLLLAMLALAPQRSIGRDRLAGLLWSENSEEQSKSSLRQAQAVLRKDLKGQDGAFFAGVDGSVTLHPRNVVLDTDLFLENAELASRPSLERAISLWRGPSSPA